MIGPQRVANNIVSMYTDDSMWILFDNALCLSKYVVIIVLIVVFILSKFNGVGDDEEAEQE